MSHVGEWAALATAALWSGSYLAFTAAVRRAGADDVNRARLALALVILALAHLAIYGEVVPRGVDGAHWIWLGLSGVVGFTIADAFLYRALYHLGAHRTSVVTALIPVSSALLAWGTLGERLSASQWIGIAVTVFAVALTVAGRPARQGERDHSARLGVVFALATVACQSGRYILSVRGMEGGVAALPANLTQIPSATVAAWLVGLPLARWRATAKSMRRREAVLPTAAGALAGPVLGVTLSLVALAHAPVGIASTLMALTPVFLLPLSWAVFREPITWRSAVGTGLAVGGVAILWLA